jgi:hypothetical protein
MNTLLIRKGVYTQAEFQMFFVEWVEKELRRKESDGSPLLSAYVCCARNFVFRSECLYRRLGTRTSRRVRG